MIYVPGHDVSYYQGSAQRPPVEIDYQLVYHAGHRFVIIRAGDGTFPDPDLARSVAGYWRDGITNVSIYHYLRFALPPADMVEQIMRGYEVAKGEGMSKQARVWLDMEDDDQEALALSADQRIAWLQDVERLLPVRKGVYSAPNYWRTMMADTSLFSHLDLWTATYPFSYEPPPPGYPFEGGQQPPLYGGWPRALVWQYTSVGSVPGIVGNVDMDAALPEYILEEPPMTTPTSIKVEVTIKPGESYGFALVPRWQQGKAYRQPVVQNQGIFHEYASAYLGREASSSAGLVYVQLPVVYAKTGDSDGKSWPIVNDSGNDLLYEVMVEEVIYS